MGFSKWIFQIEKPPTILINFKEIVTIYGKTKWLNQDQMFTGVWKTSLII